MLSLCCLQDDFLGAINLNLTRFPRGAKTAKSCSLDMLRTDGTVPQDNLFKRKITKGWWPLYAKDINDDLILQVNYNNVISLLAYFTRLPPISNNMSGGGGHLLF